MQTALTGGVDTPAKFIARDRLLRLSQVMETVGFGKTHIYQMIKAGAFPAPCKPGGYASRWSENEVLAWLADCTSSRSN